MFDRRPAVCRSVTCLALAALASALTGCGDGKIKTYPATGTVTVGGKPYPGAKVMLVPVGGSESFQKERPFGITGMDGRFSMKTFVDSDGAPAGDYQVMIRTAKPDPRKPDQAEWGRRPPIDSKYSKPDTSGLTATVEEGATEIPPFAL
ncbi:DUF4198 domain-containing protein [Botrimarina mediterranea]|uniref:Carboxypeptidase regulatory-like domain-containing protein n=1 Tax=Botrimarina mediterranea TaxID=2528022 RepID=A0A518K769_9BACT|nr:DUF4198 domain-containing protein [Botrimarina mediterranea]QDV73617.1 hypothetical protein Spa11_18150 [Botrimarina mediterranea]QDV78207.1 hypothetical protein K2D_18130 [Planctomycetes bacterium K2D]